MSQRARIPTSLPMLPGYTFYDARVSNFDKPQTLKKYTNGFQAVDTVPEFVRPCSLRGTSPAGSSASPFGSSYENELAHHLEKSSSSWKTTTPVNDYRATSESPSVPNLQGKILIFYTFFKETVSESHIEQYRVRNCRFLYYLEDDTMEVIEAAQENSGIPQGHLIKRHRIPKDGGSAYHFTNFEIGAEIPIYGKVFRVVNADEFTREFMACMDMPLAEAEPVPEDPYTKSRLISEDRSCRIKSSVRQDDLKRFMEASLGRPTHLLENRDKFTKFLANDRKVLKFFGQWDGRESVDGVVQNLLLLYFLADDTIQIVDRSRGETNSPFSTFIRRGKIPMNYDGIGDFGERTPRPGTRFYEPNDLAIGQYIDVYGRDVLINDCDDFTKKYLSETYGISSFAPRFIECDRTPSPVKILPPPHNGYGLEEDSIQNCRRLEPKPPKKDMRKFLRYHTEILRWSMRFAHPRPEDEDREFVLQFYLGDDSLSITEKKHRNSGRLEGTFLKRCRPRKNSSSELNPVYWDPSDFIIGSEITIYGYDFLIMDADEHTLHFMEGDPTRFRHVDLNSILSDLRKKLYEQRAKIRDSFRDFDLDKNGEIDIDEFHTVLGRYDFGLTDAEVLALFRRFDYNGSGTITYDEFIEQVFAGDPGSSIGRNALQRSEAVTNLTDEQFASLAHTAKESRMDELEMRHTIKKIRDLLFLKRSLFTESLSALDPNHRGVISKESFMHGIRQMGVDVTDRQMSSLFSYFFGDEENIPYQQFLSRIEYWGKGLEGPRE